MKMLDQAGTHGSCDGLCRHVRGETAGATVDRGDAPRVRMSAIAFLRAIGRYRERVGVEIGMASEYGARWWSSRLVRLCEKAGWVRLD